MSDKPPPYAPLPTAPPPDDPYGCGGGHAPPPVYPQSAYGKGCGGAMRPPQPPPMYGGTSGGCCSTTPSSGPRMGAHHQNVVISQQPVAAHSQVVVGICPVCHRGILDTTYPPIAILLAVCFFPWGLICCLAMRERRCTACGANFGS